MCIARLVTSGIRPPAPLRGGQGLLAALAITALGRIMMTHLIVHAGHGAAIALAVAGTPLLTLGYALILWNSLESSSPLRRVLCSRPLQATGRWSYSLYLWHAYPVAWISAFVIAHVGRSTTSQYLAFAATVLVLLPVSALSFRLFEQPYFRWRATGHQPAPVVAERVAV
jgi:peptidoglycan/LPS O-acetylase OafA/YrhL